MTLSTYAKMVLLTGLMRALLRRPTRSGLTTTGMANFYRNLPDYQLYSPSWRGRMQ